MKWSGAPAVGGFIAGGHRDSYFVEYRPRRGAYDWVARIYVAGGTLEDIGRFKTLEKAQAACEAVEAHGGAIGRRTLSRMRRSRHGNAIRVRFPGSETHVLDPYTGKHVHAVKGAPRRMARKHKAQEIRRVRRMLARAKPGSEEQHRLRIYLAVLMRKAGGTGSRYAVDRKTISSRGLPSIGPSWRDVPDYRRTRRRS